MKKLIILSLILAAGLTAYPQSSRSSREASSNKSKNSQVASRSSSKSSSRQVKSSSSNKSRSQATKAKSSGSKSAVSRSGSSRSSAPKGVQSRSSSSQSRTNAVKSGNSGSRSNAAVRSGSSSSRSSGAVRSGNSSSRSSSAVKSGNSASRSTRNNVGNSSASRSGQTASRSSSEQRSSRSAVKSNNNVLQSTNSRSAVPSKVTNSERGRTEQNAVKSRMQNGNNVATRSGNTSDSFNRSNRQGSKTYVSRDGREFRHQNDEVFSHVRYRTDYRDINSLRNSREFIRVHNHYHNWYNHRHVRRVVVHNHFYRPLALDIRMHRYPYRVPVHLDLCWTPHLHNSFVFYYPLHNDWNHVNYGDYIETTSSYEAMNYVGTVKRVYGKVEEVFYSPEDKTYTLYFGGPYPYHDFSVVVPRDVAKSFSWSPSWYFEDEHVWAVGLIEMWEGKPEIVLHDEQQIRRY